MDPRGRETDALVAAGGLSRLSKATGVEFPTIVAARTVTEEKLTVRRENLETLSRDRDVAVVLMGSWGRLEATAGSDDDFMCLVDGVSRRDKEVRPTVAEIWKAFGSSGKRPGEEDIFGVPVFSDDLRKIGLEDDGNKNLTRRMLLLLESRAALGDSIYERVKTGVLNAYLEELEKPYRPPRFLLNDVIRYWRTIAVDFEAKHRNREGEEWGLRNAKLRTSRRLLFAGGLLPVLECHRLMTEEIEPFLQEQFEALPTDRIAACFLRHDRGDSGARTLAAYDAFLAILDDPDTRDALKALAYADSESSEVFRRAKRLGGEIRDGLLSLLMETRDLYPLVREYAIF